MNERIKEFAKQATKEVWGNSPYNGAPVVEDVWYDLYHLRNLQDEVPYDTYGMIIKLVEKQYGIY